ncbi:NCS2 family permease [Succinatimonas hippei]|uniref:Putative permease n=2 Tax=Succinatimonas TaxID=674963 RepID=E8LJC4_SUCHY|nr:NCS2 family permease [Succinatimonas hippei]EFY07395.1 putative permease [Succinatimonas hippei YIT 12066]MCL1603871.1 NCS2 family permease [Succinatimonas hippei]MDM8120136.1 NCS2 family permease [Succinatimonas hippei]
MSDKPNTSGFLDRYFGLTAKNTSVRTEVIAGLTTFVAMAYIIFVNPSILEAAKIPHEAAVAATIWTAGICTLVMGLFANLPVAVAPGMGLNAFFSFYVCGTLGLPWQTALGAVFVSGIVFLILTITKLRQHIIDSVPMSLKCAVVVGIGMFIAFVGLQGSGIVVANEATKVTLGSLREPSVLLSALGILIIGLLLALKIQGAMLIGILSITIIGMCLGITPAPTSIDSVISLDLPAFTETFMEMDLMGAVHYGLVSVIFTFTVVELFDNIGTLIGVSRSAGLMDKDGKIENIDRALLTDSCGTMFSAIMGTCTVTSYVESTAGTNAGGRTGLTAVVVGICFILAIVFAPLAGLVPGFATAPALIIVGAMMMKNVLHVNFNDYSDSIPAFLTIVMMPLSYSIANGFGFGFTSFCLLKCLTGKHKEITPVMWVVTIVFMISFALH